MGKLWKNIDIRQHGSGNVGFTNALRVLGKVPGTITLIADIAKGFFPVFYARRLGIELESIHSLMPQIFTALAGMTAIIGHIYSVYIQFKGGKGIATGCGVFLALAPIETLAAFGIWSLFLWFFKIVSISSIVSVISLPVFMVLFHNSPIYVIMAVVMAIVTIIKHRSNINRLLNRTEPKITARKP